MDDKKSFLKGVIIGIAGFLTFNFIFSGAMSAYRIFNKVELGPEDKIKEIYSVLDKYYINDYDKEKMTESMYTGLVYGVGDPYTSYFDIESLESFLEHTEGTYAGIGVVITSDESDNKIKVMSTFENAPGAKSGIQPGDKIIKVNGTEVFADNSDEAIEMMKGPAGTGVNITIFRKLENRTFDVTVVRENIDIPTVFPKMVTDDIGYIRISNFDRVTYNQFVTAYRDLDSKNMKGLIIDVRNNPGGLLDVVTNITDVLVPKGETIVFTEDKAGKREYSYSKKENANIPLAILVNENSASASEVLSGAVKDLGAGVLVGTKTFGKGLVQNLIPLRDGSALKVTIAKYYTPSGICINGEGLTPDYVVEMNEEKTFRISNLEVNEDEQLLKAIEVVQGQL